LFWNNGRGGRWRRGSVPVVTGTANGLAVAAEEFDAGGVGVDDDDAGFGHEVAELAVRLEIKPNFATFRQQDVLIDNRPADTAVAADLGVGEHQGLSTSE